MFYWGEYSDSDIGNCVLDLVGAREEIMDTILIVLLFAVGMVIERMRQKLFGWHCPTCGREIEKEDSETRRSD